jgi:serine/threonine protein kinase
MCTNTSKKAETNFSGECCGVVIVVVVLTRACSIMRPIPTPFEAIVGVEDGDFVDFLRNLLSIDPVKRPTAHQALNHPFMRKAFREEPYTLPEHLRRRLGEYSHSSEEYDDEEDNDDDDE